MLETGRKLSEILDSLTIGILISDIDGNISQTNEAVSKILKIDEATKNDSYGEILKWWESNGSLLKDKGGPLWRTLKESRSSHSGI